MADITLTPAEYWELAARQSRVARAQDRAQAAVSAYLAYRATLADAHPGLTAEGPIELVDQGCHVRVADTA